jgi:ATP-binding cassette subfamily F protein 3
MIVGEMTSDAGKIKIGSSVRIGYYSQEFAGFNPADDLVTALRREVSISREEARNALAAFLFTEDEVLKKVGNLSGGEKSRLRLLQLTYGNYNFLVLDEPTNHLDLPSREVLEEVLQDYSGTILVVSHDRYFLNKFTEYTYELSRGQLTKYYGNYDYYRQKKEKRPDARTGNEPEAKEEKQDNYYFRKKREQKKERKRKKQVKKLESRIMELETEKEELESAMSDPDNLENYQFLHELKDEYGAIKNELDLLYEKWELYL